MSRFSVSACMLTLLIAIPVVSLAQTRGRPASRPAAPASRPAPAVRAAPPARPAPPNTGGFNFNRDINARPAPAAQQRPAAAQRTIAQPQRQPVAQRSVGQPNTPATNFAHAPNTNTSGGPYQGRFHGQIVRNPRFAGGAWGWNRGVAWQPAPIYWGGGFWGPFALASLTDSLLFGSIIDNQNQLIYPSYQVEADSPGQQLLQDYGLQQTQCGPPSLVEIWGPDNSVICAFPDNSVASGNYEVDPSTFTLVPTSN